MIHSQISTDSSNP